MTSNPSANPSRPSSSRWICVAVFLLFAVAGFGIAWAAQLLDSTWHDHDVKIDSSYDDWLDRTAFLTDGLPTAGGAPPVVRIG